MSAEIGRQVATYSLLFAAKNVSAIAPAKTTYDFFRELMKARLIKAWLHFI